MSFQAYLDTILKKTGMRPEDFCKLANQRGYLRQGMKAGEIVAWLKSEFDLGHGHAMAVYSILRERVAKPRTDAEDLSEHFKGARAKWVGTYKSILAKVNAFGKDRPSVNVGRSYLSLLRNGKKFAIIKVGAEFFDVGIKLGNDRKPIGRLERSGDWNRMVSHRVRLVSADQMDAELIRWLKAAYVHVAE
ncbi:MAG TPA: DUF4287 domain-containing protein [Candidatus Baltobacteraceae bacterium]|nr:DUF4287 domain-containing protein [Candidatus Baltobacteraceae bacterium]